MVTTDRVEKAAQAYLRALVSTKPASMVVKAILLGDSGDFSRAELKEIATGDILSGASQSKRSNPSNKRLNKFPIPKGKRKVSAYQKAFGKNLKMLKKKHPRSNISVLMKKAHRLTKKGRK